MSAALKLTNSQTTPLPESTRTDMMALFPDDRVLVDGTPHRCLDIRPQFVLLKSMDGAGLHQTFTQAQLWGLLEADRLEVERNYFARNRANLRLIHGARTVFDLPQDEQAVVFTRQQFILRLIEKRARGEAPSLADDKLRDVLETIDKELTREARERWKHEKAYYKNSLGHGSDKPERPELPEPWQVRRWLKRWQETDGDVSCLMDATHRRGYRTDRLDPKVREILNAVVKGYASNLRPSAPKLLIEIETRIGNENDARAARGQSEPKLKAPNLRTVYRAIAKLDPFKVMAARKGAAYANHHFYVVHQGVTVTRLLERVEMDEWEVPLVTVLAGTKLWETFTDKQREELQKCRCWITAAIDCASRVILALHMSIHAPSRDSSSTALRMMMSDKSALAQSAGCRMLWPYRGKPSLIVTDQGPAFGPAYCELLMQLGIPFEQAPGGHPELRGTIERLFDTLEGITLADLSGRTFANPVDRADYDPGANACVTADELLQCAVRAVADIYHQTPHAGLKGETPANAWARLSREWAVAPEPGPRRLREVFGRVVKRKIGKEGMRFLGLRYQSLELQRLRRFVQQQKVHIKVDAQDLGAISVKVPGERWIAVPCVESFAQGLIMSDWIATGERLRHRFATQAKLARPIVLEAVAAIRAIGDAARARCGIAPPEATDIELNRYERDLFRTFSIRESAAVAASHDDLLGLTDGEDETAGTAAEDTEADILGDAAPAPTSPYGPAGTWTVESDK
ncbi:Mu transposase C-terminal domain-containing protein [Microvirga sp. M2]|uniref:Mu transposase C-terminal domain-containing protein n=1 Tax=Microvirga sp. M2 TaxID=3073270 RepID=UPI0039C34597